EANKIVNGKVMQVTGDVVVVDVGYKSEGVIPLAEWYDEGADRVVSPQAGDPIEVLLEAVEDESGAIVLSYKKARREMGGGPLISKTGGAPGFPGPAPEKMGGACWKPGGSPSPARPAGGPPAARRPAATTGGGPWSKNPKRPRSPAAT